MKSLKLEHDLAQLVLAGSKTSTWRLFDDKNISVNDEVRLIDKVDPARPETWRVIGIAHVDRIVEKRLGDIGPEDMEGHETFASSDEMVTTYRKYYGNDVNRSTVVKIIHFHFYRLEDANKEIFTTKDIKKIHLFTDGGSRGNPGPSASGYVVIDPASGTVLVDRGIYLGITTNNQAEYLALKYGLEEAARMGVREVDCFLDSMLVINQMKGVFKISNRDLWPVHQAIKELTRYFDKVTFTHVPREMNKLADNAVNRALDEGLGLEPVQKLP